MVTGPRDWISGEKPTVAKINEAMRGIRSPLVEGSAGVSIAKSEHGTAAYLELLKGLTRQIPILIDSSRNGDIAPGVYFGNPIRGTFQRDLVGRSTSLVMDAADLGVTDTEQEVLVILTSEIGFSSHTISTDTVVMATPYGYDNVSQRQVYVCGGASGGVVSLDIVSDGGASGNGTSPTNFTYTDVTPSHVVPWFTGKSPSHQRSIAKTKSAIICDYDPTRLDPDGDLGAIVLSDEQPDWVKCAVGG